MSLTKVATIALWAGILGALIEMLLFASRHVLAGVIIGSITFVLLVVGAIITHAAQDQRSKEAPCTRTPSNI
jgi:glucose uptake protein GlcU